VCVCVCVCVCVYLIIARVALQLCVETYSHHCVGV
jgi:hypothetical protein